VATSWQDEESVRTGSRRFDHHRFPLVFGHDEHAIGLEGPFLLGGLMKLAVNHVEQELEESEVTAQGFFDNERGHLIGIPTALVSIDPGAEAKHQCSAIGGLHGEPPELV